MNNIGRNAALVLALFLGSAAVHAQTAPQVINVPLSRPGEPITLDISILSARIEVIGEEREDAMFEVSVAGGERRIITPSGTQSIPGGSFSFDIDEDDNELSVDADWRTTRATVLARIPRRADVELHTVNDGELIISNVTGNIELYNVNGPITARNVSGSVVAESVNDTIDVSFAAIDDGSVSSFESINGDFFVRLPRNVGVNAYMDTGQGEIMSDFEVNVLPSEGTVQREERGDRVSVKIENILVAAINGGGPVLRLKTLHGDIQFLAAE